MTVDHYAGSAQRWADGATLVYGPIARLLVARSPHPLTGRCVLDVGAGTGVASEALVAAGARPVAVDLSHDMLRLDRAARPPAAVADVRALPVGNRKVDDCVAAFVLNHLTEPAGGFAELVRATRPGGAVLACVYGNANRSEARDLVDETARLSGWEVPEWYRRLKATAVPLLGTDDDMRRAARDAGLIDVVVEEHAVDIGLTEAEQLVDYRFGQAHFAPWFASMSPAGAAEVRARAIRAVHPLAAPYRPVVVFLAARTASA